MVTTPNSIDLQAPNTFQMAFKRIPQTVYNIQRVDFPGISMGTVQAFTGPITEHDFTLPGEKLQYDPLSLGILLDENFNCYTELLDWMRACIVAPGVGRTVGQPLKEMTDATLVLQTNKFKPNKRVIFYDIYPTLLSAFSLDYQVDPNSPITFDCTFNYRAYKFESI